MALAVAVGCGGADPLSDADHIAGWANAASALGVFTHAYEPLAFADGELAFADPACPPTTDDGTVATIAGNGCIDSEGDSFHGTATIERTAGGGRVLTMTRYGHGRDGAAVGRVTGTVVVTVEGPDFYGFDADLSVSGGLQTEIDYVGTVAGGYTGPTLWNGTGTVRREGAVVHDGTVQATTVDQLRDNDICPGEGISGTTTLVSDEHTVVITYDGGESCDDDDAARWSRDGEDQGFVTGVVCAIGSPASRGGGAPVALLALAAVALIGLRRHE